jgi:threonine synthase
LSCVACAATYPPDRDLLLCATCENLLEADYDYARLGREVDRDALWRRPDDVWRWRELLPVLDPAKIVTLGEGGTPLLRADRLARSCGVRELWLKSDASNPTGSLKDRSITVSATKAVEFGYGVLACDSTGNKSSSARTTRPCRRWRRPSSSAPGSCACAATTPRSTRCTGGSSRAAR